MKRITQILLMAIFISVLPLNVFATIGVSVGTGKIDIKESLQPGGIYTLPTISVYNNGTEDSSYNISLTLNETQSQLKPNPDWFSFSPNDFSLSPGGAQTVTPILKVPFQAEPGDYFGYLEAKPSGTVQQGSATIGIAAAAKLSFSVESSNIFFAVYYRLIGLYKQYTPYSYIVSSLVVLAIIWLALRKRFSVSIRARNYRKARNYKK